ncbi:MAG: helix-turn-helix domain-containing protein [Pseudomonadota bacterium]
MHAEVRMLPCHNGHTDITLSIPSANAQAVLAAITTMLPLAGLTVHQFNEQNEELIDADDVFFNASPAMALRGFRGKMEWTQAELAQKLQTTQNSISEMENGKRPISKAMAMRLSEIFSISYKTFL